MTDPTTKHVVRDFLRHEVAHWRRYDPVARDGHDVEGVHQLRVGSRRLGAELNIFAPVLKKKPRHKLAKELRWIGRILGRQRDLDVLHDLLIDLSESASISKKIPVLAQLKQRRHAERRSVVRALKSRRYQKLVVLLIKTARRSQLRSTAAGPARDVLLPGLLQTLTSLFGVMDDFGELPSDEQLHQIRKRVKQCRYGADVATKFLGTEAAVIVDRLAKAQEVLGDLHDRVIATSYLKEQSAKAHPHPKSSENAAALELLERGLQESMDELRGKWREPLDEARSLAAQLWSEVTGFGSKN